MKTRFILKAAAILVAMIFTMNGCGSSSNSDNDRNESSGGDDLEVVPAQFEKGVALFGHDSVSTTHFTHHLSPGFGVELAKTSYDGFWASMTPIWIDGKQYVMGHSENNVGGYDNPQYKWFIQRIYPSGDFGPITDSDHFSHYYKTLITLQRPGGRVFIYGQNDWPASGNPAFTREVLPGGKLTKTNSWYNPSMSNYFDTVTPLPNNYHTCFFKHKSDGDNNAWHIECITDEGKVWSLESGHWQDGYQVALSYRIKEWTHLFRHRKHYSGGPWSIKHITDHSHMYEDIIDSGTWDKHYLSMTTFYSPEKDKQYIIGHNTDKHWFIKRVFYDGTMGDTLQSGGPWAHYYNHLFPIDFDTSYLHVDNWMERMFDTVEGFGDRNLSQIALPASHDSGMNGDDIHGCSAGGRTCNTQTQDKDIGGQLSLGARYFDIRPMIQPDDSGVDWTTGHVGKLGTDITAGCRGEGKFSIINSLKDFFADGKHSKELVILKVSHCTQPPGNNYSLCTADQKNTMAKNLAWHLEDLVVKGDDLNINEMTLNEILEKGNIILVAAADRNRTNGIFKWGYGSGGDYYLYDSYSNTEHFYDMKDDQIKKLIQPANHPGDSHYDAFLLSWTLTLSGYDAFKCPHGSPRDILDMAVKAQPRIYEYMVKEVEKGTITKRLFPNLLYVDTFNRTTTNAAIYLNEQYENLKD